MIRNATADFKNTIIIMTSNMGSHLIQESFEKYKDTEEATEKAKEEVLQLLKQTVRPEFINRIDDIVMFTPLTQDNIKQIVRLQLGGIIKLVARENITLEATNEAIDYLAKRGYDPQFGARPVKRVIQKEVMNALSKEILQGKIKAGSLVLIDSFDNGLVFRNKTE